MPRATGRGPSGASPASPTPVPSTSTTPSVAVGQYVTLVAGARLAHNPARHLQPRTTRGPNVRLFHRAYV